VVFYFPSEGRRAEDFFGLKNPTASAGFEPANLGTKGQRANPYFICFMKGAFVGKKKGILKLSRYTVKRQKKVKYIFQFT
jgi:hypothetical protein